MTPPKGLVKTTGKARARASARINDQAGLRSGTEPSTELGTTRGKVQDTTPTSSEMITQKEDAEPPDKNNILDIEVVREENPYPNRWCDPDPLNVSATEEEKEKYLDEIHKMGEETLVAYRDLELHGEELRLEFITVFRPHTIKTWNHILLAQWIKVFKKNGVYVDNGRNTPRDQKLIELLYREQHKPMELKTEGNRKKTEEEGEREKRDEDPPAESASINPDKDNNGKYGRMDPQRNARMRKDEVPPDDSGGDSDNNVNSEKKGNGHSRRKPAIKEEKGSKVNDKDYNNEYNGNYKIGKYESRNNESHHHKLVVTVLMKAMQGKDCFTGGWDEDLDTTIRVFETLAAMCELDEQEKLRSIPVMLKGDALTYFSAHGSTYLTYEDALTMLQQWYNSEDRKARILNKWQNMRLSEVLMENTGKSEVEVFRKFTADLMSLQKQLDKSYHSDQFLRDRLLTAVDLPQIQASLRDRLPRTSQQAINRVAIQLSDQQRSAGSTSTCITQNDNHNFYSLGRTFGGEAKRHIKTPWKYGKRKASFRKLSPGWMRGVKSCFVCGQDHRANTRHSKEEVTAAIDKLKAKNPSALLTVDDLYHVVNMAGQDSDVEPADNDEPTWDDNLDGDEGEERLYMAATDSMNIERTLEDLSFIHGTYPEETGSAYLASLEIGTQTDGLAFNGVTIDTGAKRKSVMSTKQHKAYQLEFGRKVPMRTPEKGIKGIGGRTTVLVEATIQIPLIELQLLIDVDFAILEEDVPSLFSIRDLIDNGLDISLQGIYLHIAERKQNLVLENYFFYL